MQDLHLLVQHPAGFLPSLCVYVYIQTISLVGSKPTIEDNPKDKIAEVGEQVVFQPRVSGNPEPTIAWYHDGAMVTSDYSLELDERGKLTIVSVELKHAGVYRYTVSNNLGSVQGQVSLFVLGEKGGLQTDGTLTFQPQTIQSVPVPLSEFGQYVEDLHISGNKGFREQFSVRTPPPPTFVLLGVQGAIFCKGPPLPHLCITLLVWPAVMSSPC